GLFISKGVHNGFKAFLCENTIDGSGFASNRPCNFFELFMEKLQQVNFDIMIYYESDELQNYIKAMFELHTEARDYLYKTEIFTAGDIAIDITTTNLN